MARVVEDSLARGTQPEALDPVVDEAAREVSARVTVIAPDGRVIADSALSGPALLALENHGSRPEVRSALADRATTVERQSATVSADLLYAAVPVHHEGRIVGVARLSRGVAAIGAEGRRLWWSAALAPGAGARSRPGSSRCCSPPRSGARSSRSWRPRASSRAGTSRPASTSGANDELGELARIINHAADEQQQRLV